jgi:hypothetical protein
VTPDVYDAWLTAGDWVLGHWPWLATALAVACVAWVYLDAIGDDYRTNNDQRAAHRITGIEPRPEPARRGTDDTLLATCNELCPDLARKEERP